MPPRPCLCQRPIRFPYSHPQKRLPCLTSSIAAPTRLRRRIPQTSTSCFHASAPVSDDIPNHYQVLHLNSSATPAEIKRQFFTLSKQYHPDKNPDDPNASTRFVEISEAYHVLSVPDKRSQYDAQLSASQHAGRHRWGRGEAPSGSYSSASFAGSRPASGLNKKRSTFRGPPPSFFKSGGYGKHSAKRAEYAHHNPHASGQSQEAGSESYGDFGSGFGPGQTGQGKEVPHFDDRRHKTMHDQVNEHISARRRRARAREISHEVDGGGAIINFLIVGGTLTMIGTIAIWMTNRFGEPSNKRTRRES